MIIPIVLQYLQFSHLSKALKSILGDRMDIVSRQYPAVKMNKQVQIDHLDIVI